MRWQNKKVKNKFIGISENMKLIGRDKKGKPKFKISGYIVGMEFHQFLGGYNKVRKFETKSQALKYAKNYMRRR